MRGPEAPKASRCSGTATHTHPSYDITKLPLNSVTCERDRHSHRKKYCSGKAYRVKKHSDVHGTWLRHVVLHKFGDSAQPKAGDRGYEQIVLSEHLSSPNTVILCKTPQGRVSLSFLYRAHT